MAIMPGAVWVPKPIPGRARRRKGRGVIYHIAVTEASSLYPGPNADWHFYVNKAGTIYQYIDTDFQAWAAGEANADCIMVETQGGVYDPEGEKLTAAQVEGWAKIAEFANQSEGVPLQLMRNSLATERGLGWHKLGCDPWRVPGGQRWSSAYGKICPGLAKIGQMPSVLARAQQLAGDDGGFLMALTGAQQGEVYNILKALSKIEVGVGSPTNIDDAVGDIFHHARKAAAVAADVAALDAKVSELNAKLDAIIAKLDTP